MVQTGLDENSEENNITKGTSCHVDRGGHVVWTETGRSDSLWNDKNVTNSHLSHYIYVIWNIAIFHIARPDEVIFSGDFSPDASPDEVIFSGDFSPADLCILQMSRLG